jgi:hypothetical protein
MIMRTARYAAALALTVATSQILSAQPVQTPSQMAIAAGAPAPPAGWKVPRTPWGDPDLRGTWPLENLATRPERPAELGTKAYYTDAEYAVMLEQAKKGAEGYERESEVGKIGAAHWTEAGRPLKQTSLIVEPTNGRYPPMTPEGERLRAQMRSSWTTDAFDSIGDFNSLDRCLGRGLPTSMTPFPYNNGVRIFQAPGYLVIQLEIVHETRIVPLGPRSAVPAPVRQYLGTSRGHWEGNTLVIETTNLTGQTPMNLVGPTKVSIPTSAREEVTERLTLTGPNTLFYEAVINDPGVFTAPFKIAYPWTRNSNYKLFEYACHEGNTVVRNYINTTSPRFATQRAAATAAQTPSSR